MEANRAVSQALGQQIEALERRLRERVRSRPEYRLLKTVPGIGETLATTIMLEASIRFPSWQHREIRNQPNVIGRKWHCCSGAHNVRRLNPTAFCKNEVNSHKE